MDGCDDAAMGKVRDLHPKNGSEKGLEVERRRVALSEHFVSERQLFFQLELDFNVVFHLQEKEHEV